MWDSYIQSSERSMESLANSFDGVKRSFAIRAGKEIRVLVDTFKVVDDEQMSMLSWDIAGKIKREMKLNEEVKVSVIREYRIVEHAPLAFVKNRRRVSYQLSGRYLQTFK